MHLVRRWRAFLQERGLGLGEEGGFTLIELLVALAAGMVVVTAAMAILITSIQLSSNNQDRIDSNQQGRLAMTRIVQALNSSCVAGSTTPVLAANVLAGASNASQLTVFSSLLTDGATIVPNEVTIGWAGGTGALTLSTYAGSASSGTGYSNSGATTSSWYFNTTPNIFTLVSHATSATINGTANTPIFQYFTYNSSGVLTPIPLTGNLTTAQAATVDEVVISFEALPTDNWNAGGRGATFTGTVNLRLSPASADASASNAPCT